MEFPMDDEKLLEEVRAVLENASTGKGTEPHWISSYQIFNKLPKDTREALIESPGMGGRGSGNKTSLFHKIAKVADRISDDTTTYLAHDGILFRIKGHDELIEPGDPNVLKLFRYRGKKSSSTKT